MDIFEYLKNCVRCTYISDLKFGAYRTKAVEILGTMDKSTIDQKQIADVSHYLGIALA